MSDRESKTLGEVSIDELIEELHARCSSFAFAGLFHSDADSYRTSTGGSRIQILGLISELNIVAARLPSGVVPNREGQG